MARRGRGGAHMKRITKGFNRGTGHGSKGHIGRTGHPKRIVTRGSRGY